MPEYRYAKGRIAQSLAFISRELKEFEEGYTQPGQPSFWFRLVRVRFEVF